MKELHSSTSSNRFQICYFVLYLFRYYYSSPLVKLYNRLTFVIMASHASLESLSAQHPPPIAHPQGDSNLQRVLLIAIYSWREGICTYRGIGRVGTSRGSSFWFLSRGTEILLRGMPVLGNRAPSGLTALDALLVIYQL